MQSPRRLFFLLITLVLAAFISQPALATIHGVRIRDGVSILAECYDGVVTGELSVPPGQVSPSLAIYWLDESQNESQPGAGFSLGRTGPDPGFITWTTTGQWTFEIAGVTDGSSGATLSLLDNGVPVFTAAEIPVHCEEAHVEADGFVLKVGGVTRVVVWQGNVTGQLVVQNGTTTPRIDLVFLSPDSIEFQPSDPDFEQEHLIGNPALATLTEVDTWAFTLTGQSNGLTSLQVRVHHIDHFDFTGPQVDLIVATSAAVVPTPVTPPTRFLPASPNPFNPRTTLRFELPRAGDVQLVVTDTQGRRVATLADRSVAAGTHEIDWLADGLPSGIYFVSLRTPYGRSTQRVVLQK